ncbi:MAG: hypothetical protein B6D73_02655 [gamma proteobacterium symbiont of Stewartia floridana]|nr:MAG: hypothetical protein B6D73_02655 [gamma proteobacterium symbiont of Stewartia floridana]
MVLSGRKFRRGTQRSWNKPLIQMDKSQCMLIERGFLPRWLPPGKALFQIDARHESLIESSV